MSKMEEPEAPPVSKKQKISNVDDALPKQPTSKPPPPKCSDFVASNLEDFYKPNPPFRLPVEIGHFSFDAKGNMTFDKSALKHYAQPSKLGLDLRVGYDKFVPKFNQTPDLTHILTWISHNWGCFLPKLRKDGSIDGKQSEFNGTMSSETSKNSSTEETRFHLRPDNLLTDIICWRGLMTKLICTPYNKSEPWKLLAARHHGTIYLVEIETDEKREKERNMSDREKQMCYWGLKFEDYMTQKESSSVAGASSNKSGTVNPLEAFCTIVRTRLNTHSIVMAGEVDCLDPNSREKTPQSYIELKTSRFIYTDRNKASFKKNKLLKWWAQSFLVGIPKIICGFRNDDGVVQSLQTFRTVDIPRESQNDLSLWQGNVCLNFLDELLKWIKQTVVKDDLQFVYVIEWKEPYLHVSASCHPATSNSLVLPDWYVQKSSPLPPSNPSN